MDHRQAPGGAAPPGASSFPIVAARVVLLLAAGVALVSGFALARARERAASRSLVLYACPMHPEVTLRSPGECPICRMALERSDRGARGPSPAGVRHGSTETVRSRLITDAVRAAAEVGSDGTLTAVLYKDDILRLGPGERGRFFLARAPASGLGVRLVAGQAWPWDDSTSKVRFRFEAASGSGTTPTDAARHTPGEVGWIELTPAPRELPVVPWSAVLHSTTRPYVLVASPDEASGFGRRGIEIGRTIYERMEESRLSPHEIVVLSGLHPGEAVVVGDAFVSDAERRLSAAKERAEELTP